MGGDQIQNRLAEKLIFREFLLYLVFEAHLAFSDAAYNCLIDSSEIH